MGYGPPAAPADSRSQEQGKTKGNRRISCVPPQYWYVSLTLNVTSRIRNDSMSAIGETRVLPEELASARAQRSMAVPMGLMESFRMRLVTLSVKLTYQYWG